MPALDIDFVRAQFPALTQHWPDWALMDIAGGSVAPQQVQTRVADYLRRYMVQLGASYPLSQRATAIVREAHEIAEQHARRGRPPRPCPRRGPVSGAVVRSICACVGLVLSAGLGCDRATVVVEQPEAVEQPESGADPLVEQDALREAVRRYAAALDARDPEAASASVVAETFVYYDDLRRAALRADREQLERWDLMSVILVLQIRSALTRVQLEELDGRGLFERAVAVGLVGDEVDEVALDEIWIAADGARGEVRIEGDPVVWLRRELSAEPPGRWLVDIPESIRVLGPAIEAVVRERVLAEGKARTAMTFVELSSEAWIDVAILDGPLDQLGQP